MSKNRIYVGPGDSAEVKPLLVEGVCTEAALPGHLLDYAAASAGLELEDGAAANTGKEVLVADVDSLRHKSVDDAWVVGENMVAIRPRSGERLHVRVATGQTLVRGTPLTRNVADPGTLIVATPATDDVLFYSDEIVTTSATELVRVNRA